MTNKSKSGIPKAICEAPLIIGGIKLPCAVLEGGVRVLSQRQVSHALGRSVSAGTKDRDDELPSFLRAKT